MVKYQIFILDSVLICRFWVRVGRACGVFLCWNQRCLFVRICKRYIMRLINTLIFSNRLLAFKIVRFKVTIDNFLSTFVLAFINDSLRGDCCCLSGLVLLSVVEINAFMA